jgi:anthraniloyl-CoA monooxygenase
MRIAVCGGGPAGLFLASLYKARAPAADVVVYEQGSRGTTYGWGIVLSAHALSLIAAADPQVAYEIAARSRNWSDLTIMHEGETVVVDNNRFLGIGRATLLEILQERCVKRGVRLCFDHKVVSLEGLKDYDCVVGADGANSRVRALFQHEFGPIITELPNRYIWYGTTRQFKTLTLSFRRHAGALFIAHAYPYGEKSTFIVECDSESWALAGFGRATEDDSRSLCERIFAEELDGHRLLSNKSSWLQFRSIENERWHFENVVLIGDALRTIHFSIGSGTRSAMEDAAVLAESLAGTTVSSALAAFEQTRRPVVERILRIAERSHEWYENLAKRPTQRPLAFAYEYMMRGGGTDHDALRVLHPKFVAAFETQFGIPC